jgi:hypothetical protein
MKESSILLYKSPKGNVKIEVIFNDETFWLTQKRMSELFGVEVPAISKHLKNIFDTEELIDEVVISKMETTAAIKIQDTNYISDFDRSIKKLTNKK